MSGLFGNLTRALRDQDRKSTRLNSSHTEIYTLSLHDALPIWEIPFHHGVLICVLPKSGGVKNVRSLRQPDAGPARSRSEEHTSELQSHRDLHSFPTRRSSDLGDTIPSRSPHLCAAEIGRREKCPVSSAT